MSLAICGVEEKVSSPGPVGLIHPGVWDKRRVSEIDLSQPRHETVFGDVTIGQWRQNYPTQLRDLIIH